MKNIITILITLIALTTANAFAQNHSGQRNPHQKTDDALRGRDFVRLGQKDTLSGTVTQIKGEWYLITPEKKYELHLGDHNHRKRIGIQLSENAEIKVTGFVYHQENQKIIDIAVCTLILEGKEYRFRDDDGTPLWQGRGQSKAHNK